MKPLNENKLDKLFKTGLTGAENPVPFREEDWTAMERLLDKKPGKKIVAFRWVYYASGIAAMLLLAFGLFFLNKKNAVTTHAPNLVKQPAHKPKIYNDQSGQPLNNPVTALSANRKVMMSRERVSRYSHPFLSLSAARKGRYRQSKQEPQNSEFHLPVTAPAATDSSISPASTLVVTASANTDASQEVKQDTALIAANKPIQPTESKKTIKKPLKNKPQFTLSILAAPDVNGVGSLGRSQVGTNVGVQVGMQLFNKLSISTGLAYAVKPYEAYNADYSSSFQPRVPPTNIAANCKVLDIPLNVSYQLLSKGKNALAIGTGLSSYLMLREHYRFDYATNPEMQPFNLDIANSNRHWFGVLNLNVSYQHRLNNRFNMLVQPYYKVPLTGIGNGNVNLQSAGVALGVSWNFNPFKKPK